MSVYFYTPHQIVLSGEGWDGGRLTKFLKAVRCLILAKYFTILYNFFYSFSKFNYFQHFDTSNYSTKTTLKFSRQFGLQGEDRGYISHKQSLSLNIKQYDKKKKQKTNKLSMGPFKKYVSCIMAFFTSFNYFLHFVNFTLTLSLCYSPNLNKKLQNERKEASAYHVMSKEVKNHIFRCN